MEQIGQHACVEKSAEKKTLPLGTIIDILLTVYSEPVMKITGFIVSISHNLINEVKLSCS
jgi:hypothetical protein